MAVSVNDFEYGRAPYAGVNVGNFEYRRAPYVISAITRYIKVKVAGIWKEVQSVYCKIAGTWRSCEVYIKDSGSWIRVHP